MDATHSKQPLYRPTASANIPRLIVVGASVGGVAALSTMAASLPADFPAPVLMVLHTGSHPSVLPELLAARGALPAHHPVDGEPIENGHIYVAPPDHHMLVEGAHVRLNRGPKEHHTRPAVDPLFLSAALSYGPAVVGVVLTGTLDDGTAGLQAIKACGGLALVQDPSDALEPGMPSSAMKYVEVDHCLPLAQIGGLLSSLASVPVLSSRPAVDSARHARLAHELRLATAEGDFMEHLEAIAQPSAFACPDCKGGLWQLDGATPVRYRCHTGHAFTLNTLQHALTETMDEALWGAVRALQEQTVLLGMMSLVHRREGEEGEALKIEAIRSGLDTQARRLRELVEKSN
ncbi:Chemotaxis response regulator protein-glutamate methylesterase [Variovorax sp. PBL-H6]|uniref:chemotaxis protein CheB n=1 Tax=Variovorax sp. PBL-H6 TaxID=434009 RepID=UPI0013170924|nr:chemotaxis protein CheB [Variovorax sp. PBL-H6]VTU15278.1 Chemotaxis response regulator protein-glutamate methylesterase [Variovorax sp. PBL-H6]